MSAPALTLHRARSGAPFATKGALAAALGWWQEEAGVEGEWLLVPHLRLVAPSPAHSTPSALARQLGRALEAVRAAATIDPAPGSWPRGALRFTRRDRWLAWLAVRLATSEMAVPADRAPLPEAPAAMKARLQALLAGDPLVLPALVRSLIAAGEFATWVASWNESDRAAIKTALRVHYAVPPAIVERLSPGPAGSPRPEPASLGEITGPVSAGVSQHPTVREARRIVAAIRQSPLVAAIDSRRQPLAVLLAAMAKAPALVLPVAAQLVAVFRAIREPEPGSASDQAAAHPLAISRRQSARSPRPAWNRSPAKTDPARMPACGTHPQKPLLRRKRRSALTDGALMPAAEQPRPRHAEVQAPLASIDRPAPQPFCETRFGGLLFLLNALTALGLYPDFTRPLDPRIEPSPCWLLERIGLAWFGRRFARDPLRGWLAARAVTGRLPGHWQIDPAWEDPAPRLVRFRQGRLACGWDRRGFMARVQPLRPRDRRLPGLGLKLGRTLSRLPLETEPWLAGLLSYLEWRLGQAGVRRRHLCLPGALLLDADQAALRLPLAELPIALRLAGLDRDPGWLPAEGCSFRFEFT